MAGTGGHFLKSVGAGLLNMSMQQREMNWKDKQQKKLDDKQKKLEDAAMNYKGLVEQYQEDKTLTNEEISQLNTAFMALGYEAQELVKTIHNNIQSMKTSRIDEDMAMLDTWTKWAENQTPENIAESYKEVKGWIQSEKGKRMFEVEYNLSQKKTEQPEDVWGQAGKLPMDVRDEYLRSKGVDIPEPAVTPTALKAPSISDYNSASNYLSKHINATPEVFNKIKAGLQNQFPNVDMSAITQESLRKPEKAVSGEPKVTTPAPTSTENIREDILNADTFADAKRIYDNYAKKYDISALGITDLKQEWGKGQIAYLNKIMKSIENLLVDRGDKGKWLSNKPVTQEIVGLKFKGERPASEVYEMLYKSYTEYLEKLKKLGIDVSQFPKIKPLSEIEKVGGTEGFFAIGGVKKGDYKSIYY